MRPPVLQFVTLSSILYCFTPRLLLSLNYLFGPWKHLSLDGPPTSTAGHDEVIESGLNSPIITPRKLNKLDETVFRYLTTGRAGLGSLIESKWSESYYHLSFLPRGNAWIVAWGGNPNSPAVFLSWRDWRSGRPRWLQHAGQVSEREQSSQHRRDPNLVKMQSHIHYMYIFYLYVLP